MLRYSLLLMVILSATSRARAAIELGALARAQTSGFGVSDPQYLDTGLIKSSSVTSLTETAPVSSSAPAGISASGYGTITAEYGTFRSTLHADASSGPLNGYVAATAYTHGEWTDVITVSSSTLPQFTPVVLTGTIVVDHTVSDPGMKSSWYVTVNSNGVTYTDSSDAPNPSNTINVPYSVFVGYTFNISQYFNAYVQTQTVIGGQSDSVALDVGHTVHFYLSAPEGVTITSQSGATYSPAAAAVPEPASMAIWGLGALGCAVAGYRRRKAA